jgi:hypothetical protein
VVPPVATVPPPAVVPPVATLPPIFISGNWAQKLLCTFANSPTECGFQLQARAPDRASLVNTGRDGSTSVRLRTEVGDNNLLGSGTMERADMYLSQADTGCYEGREQVWQHSMLFPDDFAMPAWHGYVVFDFHHTGSTGQANFHILNVRDPAGDNLPGIMSFGGYGGLNVNDGAYGAPIGPWQKNVWYDFVYHVKWSSSSDGFFDAWVNGEQKLQHRGPTMYAGQGCYLKLANYHNPVCDPYPACIGTHPPSSVIHDRVIRHDLQ